MLFGDNSILQKATDAKTRTERQSIIEQARTDILGQITENKGNNISKKQLATILNKQFENVDENTIPDEIFSEHDFELTTKGEKKYKIMLSEIFKGKLLIQNDLVNKKVKDLEIGDYVDYGKKLITKTYETNTTETGFSEVQTFVTNNQMLWRVMNKKENGDVEIVAVTNMIESTETYGSYNGLILSGSTGFLNAENILNDICSELYSTSSYGIGRSINVKDIDNLNNFNPERSEWTDLDSEIFTSTTHVYGQLREYEDGPVWNEENNEINTASNSNHLSVRHTHYSYYLPSNMPLYDTLAASVENDLFTSYYWLASRCWNSNSTGNQLAYNYNMLIRYVGMGKNQTSRASVRDWCSYSWNMGGADLSAPYACGIRAVVTLSGDINIQEDSIKDGKSETNAYELE